MRKKEKRKFEESACTFKNESECEEELEDEGFDIEKAEKELYEEED
jgi:hypothetical protein